MAIVNYNCKFNDFKNLWHAFFTYTSMKKQILLATIFLLACFAQVAQAQPEAGIHFNIAVQPIWGPIGYDYVRNYYIPDIEAYYDVPNQQFVYFDNGQWINSKTLPPKYEDFDLYRAHKIVINQPAPWKNHDTYVNQYNVYKGRNDQVPIRDSHEQKYLQNPNHPEHAKWRGDKKDKDHGGFEDHESDDWRR